MIRALLVRILSHVFESTTLRRKIMITRKLIQKVPLPLVHSHSVSYGRFKRRFACFVDFLSIEYWTLYFFYSVQPRRSYHTTGCLFILSPEPRSRYSRQPFESGHILRSKSSSFQETGLTKVSSDISKASQPIVMNQESRRYFPVRWTTGRN